MGVDFFPCDACGESICDCGSYFQCNDLCGRRWCNDECAIKDGFVDEDNEDGERVISCNFCRNEDVEDGPLLQFLLKHYKISLNKAKKLYFKSLK